MRIAVPLDQALRLITPGPVLLASAKHKERYTVTPIAWATPLDLRPPLLGIVVHHDRFLHELIQSAGEFGLSIVTSDETMALFKAGLVSGRNQPDKFTWSGLKPTSGKKIEAPFVDQAIAHLECVAQRTVEFGDHSLFVGEVIAAEADENAFDGFWNPEVKRPLHYLGANKFASLGNRFEPE